MIKYFVPDTCVLIDNPNAIEILKNGKDGGDVNEVFLLETTLNELDKLKKKEHLKQTIKITLQNIEKLSDDIQYFQNDSVLLEKMPNPDDRILGGIKYIQERCGVHPILVTNDKLLQVKAKLLNIEVQDFKESNPYAEEDKLNTGFVDTIDDFKYPNTFCWNSGTLTRNLTDGVKPITYTKVVWKTQPKHYTQNAAFELLMDDTVDLVSLSASAGMGKTHCAVASALSLVLEKKKYEKIYIFKNVADIGQSMGYLPGSLEEKIDPYVKYIKNMFVKLHKLRKGNSKVFSEDNELNPEFVEILPLTYIRGMNIDNAFVIIDEAQNISRLEMRSLLTRMGDNVKCVMCGDPDQVDVSNLSKQNNGLNWVIKLFSGEKNYGHVTLGGNKSRGPICDMVLKNKL